MVVVLTLAFGAWIVVKYALLFELTQITNAARISALVCILLVTMLSTEAGGDCASDWAFYSVYIFFGVLPLLCPTSKKSFFGELAIAVFCLRLVNAGCIIRAALCITTTLMFFALV